MIYVLEVHNKTTGKYSYLTCDEEVGYPYFAPGMFTAVRFNTFDEVRNHYQQMVSAPIAGAGSQKESLPCDLRLAAEIDGRTTVEATLTISILEITDVALPEMKVSRVVNHTVSLVEKDGKASVTVE